MNSLRSTHAMDGVIHYFPTNYPARRELRAFTLIEMLVVISIISILASMLTPALMRARNMATDMICVNNLKQQHLAMEYYLGDFNHKWAGQNLTAANLRCYIALMFWAGMTEEPTQEAYKALVNRKNASTYGIFRCPSDGTANNGEYFMNYAVNATSSNLSVSDAEVFNGNSNNRGVMALDRRPVLRIKNPSKVMWTGDTGSNDEYKDNGFYFRPNNNGFAQSGAGGTPYRISAVRRHTGGETGKANYQMGDGHVQKMNFLELEDEAKNATRPFFGYQWQKNIGKNGN